MTDPAVSAGQDAAAAGQDALAQLPRATPLPASPDAKRAVIESDAPQTRDGDLYTATGNVVLTYGDHTLRADAVTYNAATHEATATGHVSLTGGDNREEIHASHGNYNVQTETGRFYDVAGSVEMRASSSTPQQTQGTAGLLTGGSHLPGYQTSNPMIFTGRILAKTGPEDYTVYDGSVTSCLLPRPDWLLTAHRITLNNSQAKASGSTFHLLGLPILFLPYVTHPTDTDQRQSGVLIPELSYSSASNNTGSKGITIGDQAYIALGRSQDLTVGLLFYSLRGFSENATYRARGPGDDFFNVHFSALQDRGFYAPYTTTVKGVTTTTELYNNQGGQDITAAFRKRINPHTRLIVDSEYLSSYIYREVFTNNFNQAVSSDITSTLYLMHEHNNLAMDIRADRYQGLKVVPIGPTQGAEVKIFHAPSIDLTGLDHRLANTPLLWDVRASATGVKRIQPNFTSSGMVERLDMRPEIVLPLHGGGWNVLASAAVEDTYYSRSRKEPYTANARPIELTTPINRASIEMKVDIRPPVLERDFQVPARLQKVFGTTMRHTIEPSITYKNVHGVDNFLGILRFDDLDLLSDTDELEYGVLQHLYFRPRAKKPVALPPGCAASAKAAEEDTGDAADPQQPTLDANGIPVATAKAPDQPTRTHKHDDPCAQPVERPRQQEWFSWQLAQKHFFAQNFGGAVINTRRNIFDTTLDFSGIAFLTEPRSISPLKSRLRLRTSSHTDAEWDFDFDTGAKKFTSQNIFLDAHEGKVFTGFSYAKLNAPGRFYTENINTTTNQATGLTGSAVSNFEQMRFLLGYGLPSLPGLSAAGGSGIDLRLGSAQYLTVQASYNWNCCGLSVEYRKYDLGTVRNEGTYSFNFTLANIGTAGNLRRAQSLF